MAKSKKKKKQSKGSRPKAVQQQQQDESLSESILSPSSNPDNEPIPQSVSCLSGLSPVDCIQQTQICIFGCASDVDYAIYRGFNVIIDDDTVSSKEIMAQFAQSLSKLFPYLIECWFFYHSRLNELFPLVLSCGLKLQKIIIIGSSQTDEINHNWWTAIWKHSSVNHLTWKNMCAHIPNTNFNIPYAHLRVMRFVGYDGDLVPIIKKCSANLELLELESMSQFKCDLAVMKRVFADNGDIGLNASKLQLDSVDGISLRGGTHANLLELIVKHFKNLKVLEIEALQKLYLADIVLHVAKLTDLTDLTVYCLIGSRDFASTKLLSPLRTVTNLDFGRTFPFGYSVEQFKSIFPRLFPNLSKLRLKGENRHFIETIHENALELFPGLIEYNLELLNVEAGTREHYKWKKGQERVQRQNGNAHADRFDVNAPLVALI